MKEMMFATHFPKGHPRAGQATGFPEKILAGEKIHTLRQSDRLQVGDVFQPKIWSGAPYRSPKINVGEPLTVTAKKSVGIYTGSGFITNVAYMAIIDGAFELPSELPFLYSPGGFSIKQLAENDGLDVFDFLPWFFPNPKPGQEWNGYLYCWHPDPTSIPYLQ